MDEERIGQVLGKCRITQLLRRGGMSTIYLAEQMDIGRPVVLKVMSSSLLGDPTFMERFEREVATTARLQHPHIVPIYEYGRDGDVPYIIMAYMAGGSLEDLLADGPLSLDQAARIIRQVAHALDFAHAHGVIHRDVKPANILLDGQGNAILTDFGIAKVVAATQHLTRDALIGTPSYLAPELIVEETEATPAADIYGLGVTLYRMLAGDYPFRGSTPVQLMWAHVNEPAPTVTGLRPDLPPGIDAVVQKALAKMPGARYTSASALADDLAQVAAGQAPPLAVAAPAPTIVSGPVPQAQRLEEAVRQVIDQVVKIILSSGGSGSGVYLPDQRVLTCAHVVDGAPGLYVQFRTGERVEADVLAVDHASDLALLALRSAPQTLDARQLDGLGFEGHDLEPGEPLAAIGHPLGLDWAVTGGHFNGLRGPDDQALHTFGITLKVPLVQVDVAINPGNSGGPLIDTAARLVGIADSMINPALANNIGFAVDGQAAYGFWQTNKDLISPLVPYTCGHHHAAELTYCPMTGRRVEARKLEPMPPPDAIRYSCGHFHPMDTPYCPLTGKPARPVAELPTAPRLPRPESEPQGTITCRNCGTEFPASDRYCATCGRPVRPSDVEG
jgi:tRNA A-37 threonylcarbamoyl transferase component Bud32